MNPKMSLVTMILAGMLPLAAVAAEQMKAPAAVEREAEQTQPAVPGARTPGAGADVAPMFKELDRDGDGYVSKEEARRSADTQAQFSTMDTDGDGRLSLAEWNANSQSPKKGGKL